MASAPLSPRIDHLLGSMSLEQKVGQIFVFTFVSMAQARHDLRLLPGGYIRIYGDALSLARQNAELQHRAGEVPLIISADFESGIGVNVSGAVDMVSMMTLGAADDEALSHAAGEAIAREARALGVNMNYVPVLDVNVNEQNPIINIRSFGADPHLVARQGAAFIKGTRAGGVLACGKHFPGHGDTSTDSHSNLGAIAADKARMNEVELVPFRAAIEAGVDAMMSAHLLIPAYESERLPATLSRRIMHGLLREELGFEGVVVSDALEMGGISKHFSLEEATVRAFNAGVDQLIMPTDNERSRDVLLAAVRDGRVSEARLNEAVARILTMKEQRGLFEAPPAKVYNIVRDTAVAAHEVTALQCALAGATMIKGEAATDLLTPDYAGSVACITFSNGEDYRSYWLTPKTVGVHLAQALPHARCETVNCGTLEEAGVHEHGIAERAVAAAARADTIVVGAFVRVVINAGTVELEPRFADLIRRLLALNKRLILASFGSPYIIKSVPEVGTFLCLYSGTEACQEAGALVVAGHRPAPGKLPVSLTL